ncbi:immunity 52 family protein [Paraburkholderia youngii]|uniref:immunity 52 family protein n=1 Tax=Paraburkholderia youngii TaxID=2782701 RepID=UPI003D2307E5
MHPPIDAVRCSLTMPLVPLRCESLQHLFALTGFICLFDSGPICCELSQPTAILLPINRESAMNLFSQHRDADNIPSRAFLFHFERLRPVIELLARKDRLLENWYLKGGDLGEALKYRAYEDDRPTKDAMNEVADRYKGKADDAPKTIGIWNGTQADDSGAAFSISIDGGRLLPQSFELAMDEKSHASSRLGGFRSVAEVVAKIAEIYDSFYVTFGPRRYFEKQVFDDRLGVSWIRLADQDLLPRFVDL